MNPIAEALTIALHGKAHVCTECPGMSCILLGLTQEGDGEVIAPDKCPWSGAPSPWRES